MYAIHYKQQIISSVAMTVRWSKTELKLDKTLSMQDVLIFKIPTVDKTKNTGWTMKT